MSKVTAKYQVTIPPEIRKELGIFPGIEVAFSRKGDAFKLIVDPVETLKKNGEADLRLESPQINIVMAM